MTGDGVSAEVQAEPEVLEFGRYRALVAPDGSWWVYRAVETCERCQECGCGSQADPITVPAMIVKMAGNRGMMGKMRAVMGLGNGNGTGPEPG